MVEPADILMMPPLLAFAGIAPATVSCDPLSQHIAEKVHAYVRPHVTGPNTRVRDLVDLVMIARHCSVNGAKLHEALQATFAARDQGTLPPRLSEPPTEWRIPFKALCVEVGLGDLDPVQTIAQVRDIVEPALTAADARIRSPAQQAWT